MAPTSDNGVNANFWMDIGHIGIKVDIPITTIGFHNPLDGVRFQNISTLLVHIALSTRALSTERRKINDIGAHFNDYVREIVENEYNYDEI